jgi:hypothetical protein
MVDILMPYAETRGAGAGLLSTRLPGLEGRTLGIINNSWRCMNVIAEELAARLKEDHGVVAVVEERISAAQTLPDDRLRGLAQRCDGVAVGIGN